MTAEKRVKLANIIAKLPEKEVDSLYETACRLYESHANDEKPGCPYCHSKAVVRNGHKCGKQEYRCKDCGKTFVSTTNTLMANSHQPRATWEAVIDDWKNSAHVCRMFRKWMRPMSWSPIRERNFLILSAVSPVSMAQKQKREGFLTNTSAFVPVYSVKVVQ